MMNYSYWTRNETQTLTRAYHSGANYRQILALLPNRTFESVKTKIRDMGLARKYETLVKDKRVGHFDIETSQLNASFGFLISWAIKEDGPNGKTLYDALNKSDFVKAGYDDPDKRIVTSMVNALNEFDVITYHFGDYFDGPMSRSRALFYKLPFPENGALQKIDTWKWAKRNLKLHSNRLEAIAEFLGVNTKTHLDPRIWRRASRGDIQAVNYIVEHNKQDVLTLEKVYNILKPYSNGARSSI